MITNPALATSGTTPANIGLSFVEDADLDTCVHAGGSVTISASVAVFQQGEVSGGMWALEAGPFGNWEGGRESWRL